MKVILGMIMSIPDEGYSRNVLCTKLDYHIFISNNVNFAHT